MTDLVLFKVDEEHAERVFEGLKRDYYKRENVFAVGEPKYKVSGGKALFFCPVMYPVGGMVKRFVEKQIINGFKSSFAKAGIVLERVKSSKKYEDEFNEI